MIHKSILLNLLFIPLIAHEEFNIQSLKKDLSSIFRDKELTFILQHHHYISDVPPRIIPEIRYVFEYFQRHHNTSECQNIPFLMYFKLMIGEYFLPFMNFLSSGLLFAYIVKKFTIQQKELNELKNNYASELARIENLIVSYRETYVQQNNELKLTIENIKARESLYTKAIAKVYSDLETVLKKSMEKCFLLHEDEQIKIVNLHDIIQNILNKHEKSYETIRMIHMTIEQFKTTISKKLTDDDNHLFKLIEELRNNIMKIIQYIQLPVIEEKKSSCISALLRNVR